MVPPAMLSNVSIDAMSATNDDRGEGGANSVADREGTATKGGGFF